MIERRSALGPLEALVALAVVTLDQTTKWMVVKTIPLHGSVEVIPGLFSLTYVQNTGAAFGLLNAVDFPFKTAVVTAAALAALVTIAIYAARIAGDWWVGRLGLALVLAGAIGNLIDRALRGYVVDFFDWYYRGWHFWAFNIADSAITVGACALILDLLTSGRHAPQAD